jgi:hypothetical protein
MQVQIVEELYLLVATAFRLESKAFDYELWTDHIKSMIMMTSYLARRYGADEEIVVVAVLLHHLSFIKLEKNQKEHHSNRTEETETLLSHFGYPADRIERVKKCILNQRGSEKSMNPSIEEAFMADTQALAHIRALASLFHEVYERMDVDIDHGVSRIRGKLQQDWENVSSKGKRFFMEQYETILNRLQALSE